MGATARMCRNRFPVVSSTQAARAASCSLVGQLVIELLSERVAPMLHNSMGRSYMGESR